MSLDISPLQMQFVRETLQSAYAEMDASDEFSQKMLDDFVEVMKIMGVSVEG